MIRSCIEMMDYIQQIGFLPLLDSGIPGFSAEDMVDEDCRYVIKDDGGWEWRMWKWKGQIVTESDCVYGKFFNKKAGYVSKAWWQDFCNLRRSRYPLPAEDSIEGVILDTLRVNGSIITRDLRKACDFTGPNMRSKFDGYVTKLEMGTYIVTEDFVYPRDKHNNEYGWGWSLLNTPEALYGNDACTKGCTPEESEQKIFEHLKHVLPQASDAQIKRLLY